MKDLPASVPERRRADSTAVDPSSGEPAPSTNATQRDVIVPSVAPTNTLLDELRKAPAERLVIESRVASGGMGTIEVAIDRALDRRIALKTLHPHMRATESGVRMFLREARLTALLDHPNIVPLYDVGERDDDRLYFAMKLVQGQTLADIVRTIPRGPIDTATLYSLLDIVIKVGDALAFAHSRGVIHCDIKPANVMVGDFGQVYLMDWGIARLVAVEMSPSSAQDPDGPRPHTASATDHSIIGTPCYMSPEQARGDRALLDQRSDVFLLGALLYEVLTRRPPYGGADRNETLALAAAGTFPAPRRAAGAGAVPPELDRIVVRAMQKRPEDRYPNVSAMREDIARFMRGGGDFPRKAFAAGALIVHEGDPGDAAYIVVSGRCDVQKAMPDGTDHVMHTLEPGDVFGEMAILTDGPRTATVVAVEDTTVLVVTSAVLEQEMAALKPWMATLLKSLATRFRDIDTKHRATYAASPSPARLANQVLMHLMTWGEPEANGARAMTWSVLAAELEAQLGIPPLAIFGAITRYGMHLDLDRDRLTIADCGALATRLRADLSRLSESRTPI